MSLIAASTGERQVQRLRANSLGLTDVVFMVVATAAPITAMTGTVPILVGYGNGTGAPAGYLVALAILLLFSVGYVMMAKHITSTGAFYGYISQGLGPSWGMASGLLTVITYIAFEAAVAGIFASFADTFFRDQFGLSIPWPIYAAAFFGINAFLGHKDIQLASKVLIVLLISEVSILALTTVAVFADGGGPDGIPLSSINPINAFEGPSPSLALFFAFASWVGFEATAMYGEESREPKKIIPRATFIAVIGIGIFYVLVSWAAISANGLAGSVEIAQNDPFGLFFGPSRHYFGEWSVFVMQLLMMTGSIACGSAFHNSASRYLYAMGREGFFHRRLGHTHRKHGSPYFASFVETLIGVVIVGLFWLFDQDPYLGIFTLLSLLGTVSILVVQILCSGAVIGYFSRHHKESRHWFKTLLAPILGGAGMVWMLVLLIQNLSAAAGEASDTLFFKSIPWIVIGAFVLGMGLVLYLKKARPDRYAAIGKIVMDDAAERDELPPLKQIV
jgi:Amino acid transporters